MDRQFLGKGLRAVAAGALIATTGFIAPAAAQELMQLTVPPATYTFGRFEYGPPTTDGWRQLGVMTNGVSLVYAEQPEPDKIATRFGVAIEAHDIPEGAAVADAAALAETSRRQMSEARKADLVSADPIEPVPSTENLYTYRLLTHSPVAGEPDVYEVYYVSLAPDKSQYVVFQCITKSLDYANQIYFQEFYGSLASLKYVPPEDGDLSKGRADNPAAAAAPAGS